MRTYRLESRFLEPTGTMFRWRTEATLFVLGEEYVTRPLSINSQKRLEGVKAALLA